MIKILPIANYSFFQWRQGKNEVEMVYVRRFEGKHMPRIQKERQATRRLGSMRVGVRAQPQTNIDADLRG